MKTNGRQRCFARNGICLAFGLLFVLFHSLVHANPRYTELELKAAYIFNFIKFVEWPQEAERKLSRLHICAYSDDPILPLLKKLEAERVRQLKIETLVYDSVADIHRCQLIYLDVISSDKRAEILRAARNKPILTIGNEGRYADNNEIINFFSENARLRFDINYLQARQSGLQMSSQLLRLARISEHSDDE